MYEATRTKHMSIPVLDLGVGAAVQVRLEQLDLLLHLRNLRAPHPHL